MVDREYQNYFLRIVYVAFMEYIVNGIGIVKFNTILRQEHMFDGRKGVNPKIGKLFRRFLESNPKILEVVSKNKFKVFTPKNISGGPLASPINCDDDGMMIRERLRLPLLVINRELFKKTNYEKERLKRERCIAKLSSDKFMFRDVYRKPIGYLVVHTKNENKTSKFKTTHTYKCAKHEVRAILGTFHEGQIITGLKFNGRNI